MSRLETVKVAEKMLKLLETLESKRERTHVLNFLYALSKEDYTIFNDDFVSDRDLGDENPGI